VGGPRADAGERGLGVGRSSAAGTVQIGTQCGSSVPSAWVSATLDVEVTRTITSSQSASSQNPESRSGSADPRKP
jgi:hypothetical protein